MLTCRLVRNSCPIFSKYNIILARTVVELYQMITFNFFKKCHDDPSYEMTKVRQIIELKC